MLKLKLDKDLRNNILLVFIGLTISIILPTDIFYTLRSLLKFIFISYYNLWILCIVYIAILLYFKRKNTFTSINARFKFIVIHFCLLTLIVFIISTISALRKEIPLDNKLYMVYGGCYTQNSIGYLVKDNSAIKIDRLFEYEFKQAGKLHETFNNELTDLISIKMPDFIMSLMKSDDINMLVAKKVNPKKVLCVISFIRNIDNSNIEVNVEFNEDVLIENDTYDRFTHIFTSISRDENINQEYLIRSVAKFYTAVIGQGVLHTFLLNDDISRANRAIIDSENLFIEATNFLISHGNESTISKAKSLRNYWLTDLEIYKSEVHYKRDYILSCLTHLFNAFHYDLYYPHESYNEMKYRLLADYELGEDSTKEQNYFNYVRPTVERLKSIVIEFKDPVIADYVQKRFLALQEKYSNDPLFWYYYGEIIKYCYTEGKMINEVYVNRLDESIKSFEKVLELDPTFSLVYSKLIGMYILRSESVKDSLKIKEYRVKAEKYLLLDMTLYDLEEN